MLKGDRLFNGFLALLIWAPLPFGSNRPWAASIIEVWVFALSAIWLRQYASDERSVTEAFRNAKPVLALMVIWMLYGFLQVLPLPAGIVSLISPTAAHMHQLAGNSAWMTISVDVHESLSACLRTMAYLLAFCLCLLLAEGEARIRALAYTLVFSALFQAFYGSTMMLSGLDLGFFIHKYSYLDQATGTYINRNHLAGYLEMCIPVGIGLMISMLRDSDGRTGRQKFRQFVRTLLGQKLRLRLYLAVMVIALVLTHSRMGNAAFFFSLLAAGLLGLMARNAPTSLVVLLVSLVLIDIVIVGTWFGMEKVVHRLENTSMVHDAGRVDVTQNSIRLWRDYKLTGSGGGSFYTVFPAYRTRDIASYYDHAHDDYIEIASEYGGAGIMILGLIVLFSLVAALKGLFRRRNPLAKGMAFSAVMGIISLMIHGFVDFNLQIPANALTFMVVMSLGWISHRAEREKNNSLEKM